MFLFLVSIYKSRKALQSHVALGIGNFAEYPQSQQSFIFCFNSVRKAVLQDIVLVAITLSKTAISKTTDYVKHSLDIIK